MNNKTSVLLKNAECFINNNFNKLDIYIKDNLINKIDTNINISPTIKKVGIVVCSAIKKLICSKDTEPTNPYIRLVPNKNIQVDKLPIIKYFTPASDEKESFLEKETSI